MTIPSSSFDLHLSLAIQLKGQIEKLDVEIEKLEHIQEAVAKKLKEVKDLRRELLKELILTTDLVARTHAEMQAGKGSGPPAKKRSVSPETWESETPRARRARSERERFAGLKRHWERKGEGTLPS